MVLTININERVASGKVFLEFLKSLCKTSNYVDIIPKQEKYPYNPEFVEKIQRSMNSKGQSIKLEDLWK